MVRALKHQPPQDISRGLVRWQIGDESSPDQRHDGSNHVIGAQRSEARDGELIVARLPDGRSVLGRYRSVGRHAFLESLDEAPRRYEEFELCGVAIGMMRKYGLAPDAVRQSAQGQAAAPCAATVERLGCRPVQTVVEAEGLCTETGAGRGRTILHVDIDAFFAAVEQVLNPELQGRPVIVGGWSTDRSVVASASYEARSLGIRVAMPLAQAVRICPDAVFLRGKFERYQQMSRSVMALCADVAPIMEIASMDEAYLDLTGCERLYGSMFAAAEQLKRRVKTETGLTVSVGIAANKLLAKIASDLAKPDGILAIWARYGAAFLAPLSLAELPGVGPRMRAVLDRYNLHTIGELTRAPKELLVQTFGPLGEALYQHARGQDASAVEQRGLPKSISRETTFEQDTADRAFLLSMIYYLTERAARQLRYLGMKARTVTVKLRYSDFQTISKSRSLRHHSRQDDCFYRLALHLLEQLYTRRVRVRLVGLRLSDLTPGSARQRSLFGEEREERRDRLYASVDRIRERFGFSAVTMGPAIGLLDQLDRDREGFQLRTPSLSQ